MRLSSSLFVVNCMTRFAKIVSRLLNRLLRSMGRNENHQPSKDRPPWGLSDKSDYSSGMFASQQENGNPNTVWGRVAVSGA